MKYLSNIHNGMFMYKRMDIVFYDKVFKWQKNSKDFTALKKLLRFYISLDIKKCC